MTKHIARRIVAVVMTAGLSFGIASIGSAPAQADSSWGRSAPQDSSWGRIAPMDSSWGR